MNTMSLGVAPLRPAKASAFSGKMRLAGVWRPRYAVKGPLIQREQVPPR